MLCTESDEDGGDIGVRQITEHEVHDPILATKRHGGLGAVGGQRVKPFAFSTSEHEREECVPLLVEI